ncbi:hypothetical protein RND71_042065 [Anisodus tanguticus]|uniref:Adenylosuccinate lyase n=1 Tax=Anisodus tanguticus TaxID=243964 RepID=A0AAE1QRV7_9SOLA|nr:hypothetical protein RND71_042065 [Anisodus tanguticus]
MSEYGLIRFRILVEIKWLIKMSQIPQIVEVPSFSEGALAFLQDLIDGFSMNDALDVKKIERVTNHDVKAVEYFLKQRCQSPAEISKKALCCMCIFLYFVPLSVVGARVFSLCLYIRGHQQSCACIDVERNFEHGHLPVMDELIKAICDMATTHSSVPLLSRTHGQPASPTTLGKEMSIFAYRLNMERKEISQKEMLGKFAGAVGNYNAHLAAYREINWPEIAEEFMASLGLEFNPYVPQIETHDYMAKLFHSIVQFNNILVDFDRDVWGYISLGYFKQTTKAGEIGSSTMPHKVNPIDFENSEGNLGVANGDLSHLSTKLPISRWQRDLTDSTVLRNMGVGLGHSLLAYISALQGINKLQVNEAALNEDLDKTWEVLAEPIQTLMRRYGVPEPYEKLKELTRGRAVNKESIREFIKKLDIPVDAKTSVLNMTPHTYIGTAAGLVKNVNEAINLVNGVQIL